MRSLTINQQTLNVNCCAKFGDGTTLLCSTNDGPQSVHCKYWQAEAMTAICACLLGLDISIKAR